MTKQDLVNAVSERSGLKRAVVESIINTTLNVSKESVVGGQTIYLRGFGTLGPKTRKAKTARIIATGEACHVPERTVPAFKPCFSFRQEVEIGKLLKGNQL
ncbi:MAG: hypothetical protein A2X18_07560 [Bacteroidetes bacterium GWF2_40_14]|nr:MAG: hypothetical protein A2X18_07560 [Bacteroidetes bacterium GWF2_40_14]